MTDTTEIEKVYSLIIALQKRRDDPIQDFRKLVKKLEALDTIENIRKRITSVFLKLLDSHEFEVKSGDLHYLDEESAKDLAVSKIEVKRNDTMMYYRSFGVSKSEHITGKPPTGAMVINRITQNPISLNFEKLDSPSEPIGLDRLIVEHYDIIGTHKESKYDVSIGKKGSQVVERTASDTYRIYSDPKLFISGFGKKFSRVTGYNSDQEKLIMKNLFGSIKLDTEQIKKDSEIDVSFMINMILSRLSDLVNSRIRKYKIDSFVIERLAPDDEITTTITESAIHYYNEFKKDIYIQNGFAPGQYMVDYLAELNGLCSSFIRGLHAAVEKISGKMTADELQLTFDQQASDVMREIVKTNKNIMQILLLKDQLLR